MIYNSSRKKVISREFSICKSSISKALGLMFCIKPRSLVFVFEKEKIIPLHMLFVFFQIDVVYLNKRKEVVEIKEGLRQFRFYTPKKKAMYVVELPAGAVRDSGTSVGNRIELKVSR